MSVEQKIIKQLNKNTANIKAIIKQLNSLTEKLKAMETKNAEQPVVTAEAATT